MLTWLAENVATIVVCIILIGIVAAIIYKLITDKKKGKSSCGGGCSGCVMRESCHSKNKR